MADLYVSVGNVMATACRSAPNKLCLLCVQLQPIARRPTRDIVDALRHVGLERAGVRRRGPAVDLGVVCIPNINHTVGEKIGLLSQVEYTCVLVSFIELPLVRSIHEPEKKSSQSQCRTAVLHCCKGDAARQLEMAIWGVSELYNP